MAEKEERLVGSSLSKLEKLVGIVIAVLTAWAAFQSGMVKDRLVVQSAIIDSLKTEIAKNADDRETRKLNHEITIQIFEEVKDIYKTPNQTPDQILNRLLAVSALVEAIPESEVRLSLAAAVKAAADNVMATTGKSTPEIALKTEAVKKQVDLTVFRADQNDTDNYQVNNQVSPSLSAEAESSSAEAPKWLNYGFDFFWCESASDPEAAKNAAELAAAVRQLDPAVSGRWRVRKLPAIVNNKAAYRVKGYKINVNSDGEQKVAEVLADVLKQQMIPAENIEFEITRIKFPSPWYISVFFCPGAVVEKQ